jgi:hypothetical protein
MSNEFSAIAHGIYRNLAGAGVPAPLGHIHQLLAACLGYRSFAAYKASLEEGRALSTATHVLIDERQLRARGMELGYGDQALDAYVAAAWTKLHRPEQPYLTVRSAYQSLRDLQLSLYEFVWMEFPRHDQLAVEARRIGGEYADTDIVFLDPPVCIAQSENEWLCPFTGMVYLEDSAGEPLWTALQCEGYVRFTKAGRVCLRAPTLGILKIRAEQLRQLRVEAVEDYSGDDVHEVS